MTGKNRWFGPRSCLVSILTLFAAGLVLSGCSDSDSSSSTDRFLLIFNSQDKQLKLHILDDDLLHLEWKRHGGI